MTLCSAYTIRFIRSLKFNDLMRRPLGRATWCCFYRLLRLGAQTTLLCSLGRSLGDSILLRFGFLCLVHFGWGQNAPNTMCPQPRINLLFFCRPICLACPEQNEGNKCEGNDEWRARSNQVERKFLKAV